MTTTVGPGQVALLLQQYRAGGGFSQEELPAQAGLSRRGVSDLERGRRQLPHPATVRRLADGLGLTASKQRTRQQHLLRRNLRLLDPMGGVLLRNELPRALAFAPGAA
jgi:transcriptional regulator with XRE-family HTH domain